MRRAQKPIEYGPRTPLRGFKEGAKNPERHECKCRTTRETSQQRNQI
jgi:hypothetical protein